MLFATVWEARRFGAAATRAASTEATEAGVACDPGSGLGCRAIRPRFPPSCPNSHNSAEDRALAEHRGNPVGVPKQGLFAACRGPRCGLVAPCGSGQPAVMRFARFAASCPRGYRVDGAIVLVLCGTTAHRPACSGRDPIRKTADLAYNGRNSSARRELKLFRDVYASSPNTPHEPDPPRQPDEALRIA
jgi:hypothetical protein